MESEAKNADDQEGYFLLDLASTNLRFFPEKKETGEEDMRD